LVVGNHFAHKGISQMIPLLRETEWPVVILGGQSRPETEAATNIRWMSSGYLTKQHISSLFHHASVVVYPSHYEGFGLPVTDALALGKPVIALDNAMNRELARITADPNLHLIPSAVCLLEKLDQLRNMPLNQTPAKIRVWRDSAAEYAQSFRRMLSQSINVPKLRARWDFIRSLEALTS
jgi:glycosyltransferase involved in cell wall biosynthesis